jgi:hypothetical protein
MNRALPRPLHVINEGLAFVIEVLALVALGWWGFSVNPLLGIAAPLAAIILWGLFAAPKARYQVGLVVVLLVKDLVFGVATVALFALGKPGLAITFAILAVINTAIVTIDRNAAVAIARRTDRAA